MPKARYGNRDKKKPKSVKSKSKLGGNRMESRMGS